ncbi:MAG TPA: hypothetical protein VM662_02665 [Sphingomonas sp.]|nr:hypothetical protein [Sphingomonas sp.]
MIVAAVSITIAVAAFRRREMRRSHSTRYRGRRQVLAFRRPRR